MSLSHSVSANAGPVNPLPQNFTIEGRLYDSAGNPLNSNQVDVQLELLVTTTGGSGDCVIYRETHSSINVASSNTASAGVFSLRLGAGTRSFPASAPSITSLFSTGTFTGVLDDGSTTSCSATAVNGDFRYVRVKVQQAAAGFETLLPDTRIAPVPTALVAESAASLDGVGTSSLVFVNTNAPIALSQSNLESVFASSTNVANLLSVISGTAPVSFSGRTLTGLASPGTTSDAATKGYADSTLLGRPVDTSLVASGTGTNSLMVWNQAAGKWIAQTFSAAWIPNTSVTPGTYGTGALKIPNFTVGSDGRLLAAGETLLTSLSPSGTSGGDLTGSYPSPTIASNKITTAKLMSLDVTPTLGPGKILMTDPITGNWITYASCNTNEVLAGTGSGWACTSASTLSAVTSVAGKTGVVTLNASDIAGLGTVAVKDYGTSAGQIVQLDATGHIPSALISSSGATLTSITAGQSLLGGGTSGGVTLNVDVGSGASKVVVENSGSQIAQLEGSVSQPAYSFVSNPSTGLYSPGSNKVALTTLGTAALTIDAQQRVGIGTTTPNALLDVNGTLRVSTICDSSGLNCKTVSSGWSAGGTMTSILAGTGLLGGNITTAGTLSVDAGTGANQIVQMTLGSQLPNVDGSLLTGVNAAKLQTYAIANTPPSNAQVLKWNSTTVLWEPQPDANSGGTVTSITAGTGMTSATITSSGTLNVNTGTGTSQIPQLSTAGQLLLNAGLVTSPAYSFFGNPKSGLYSPGLGSAAIATNGTARMTIDGAGNVGIGAVPYASSAMLVSNNSLTNDVLTLQNRNSAGLSDLVIYDSSSNPQLILGYGNSSYTIANFPTPFLASSGDLNLITNQSAPNPGVTTMKANGAIGIGTTSPSAFLDVYGTGALSSLLVPRESTANRPSVPVNGMIRYNINMAALETYASGSWQVIASGPTVGKVQSITTGVGLLGGPITANGTLTVDVGTNSGQIIQAQVGGQIQQPWGTPSAPSYSFGGNSNTGLFSPGAGTASLSTNGSPRLTVDGTGNVGIGTTIPAAALEVTGGQIHVSAFNAGSGMSINWNNGNNQYTSPSTYTCGAITLNNLLDGGTYTLSVQGVTSGLCTFSGQGLTYVYNPPNAPVVSDAVYTFLRMGTKVYISWVTGFQ